MPSLADNPEVSRWLMERAISDLGGKPIEGPSEEGDEILVRMMMAEVLFAMSRTDVPTSHDWYTKSIRRMVAVAATMHPEISDDEAARAHKSGLFRNSKEAQTVLFSAMAITSQNIAVVDNMRYALEQYRAFLEDGRFRPVGYGAKGGAVESNLARFNFILDRARGDLTRVRRLLTMKMKMSELQAMAAKYGIRIAGKELAEETVYGSMLFGPKVGNGFLQNLLGNHTPVTIDLWFMRLWGRYTGTLVRDEVTGDAHRRLAAGIRRSLRSERMASLMERGGVAAKPADILEMDAAELFDYAKALKNFWEKLRRRYVEGRLSDSYNEKNPKKEIRRSNDEVSAFKAKLVWPGAAESLVKSLGMPVDSPRNASIRKWIRSIVGESVVRLNAMGYPITAADLQAILWYPEKEIYGKLTGRPMDRLNMSYDEAIMKIARNEGVAEELIHAALEAIDSEFHSHPVPRVAG